MEERLLENKNTYREEKIVYFDKPGKGNTEVTLDLVAERAKVLGIKKIVLASTRGVTARMAMERFKDSGIQLIVVPHQYGFDEPERFQPEIIDELESKGHRFYASTMLFHTDNFYGTGSPSVMATLLRTFCQGFKVCIEIVLMVVDGGCVTPGEQVIVVSGTGRGADTAMVALAASTRNLHDLHITEIICKMIIATTSINSIISIHTR
jgi:hypothetical protein